jgi:hypothetical protein
MKETILRDGEIAFVVGGVEVIMNDNTMLGLLEKFGLIEKVDNDADKPEGKLLGVVIDKIVKKASPEKASPENKNKVTAPACPACPYKDGTVVYGKSRPVVVFEYDNTKVAETGNRYAGFVRRVNWFESAWEAEKFYNMSKGTVSTIARTWAYIIERSWNKTVAYKNKAKEQYANKTLFSGTYDCNIPYRFTATNWNGDGKTLAFVYVEDLPQNGFLV